MSINIPTHFAMEFSTNVGLLLQQKGSKLRPTVMEGSHKGKQASPVDQLGSIEANKVTSRFAPMPRTDATTDRRWVFPTDYDVNQLIDSFDRLRLITDPDSAYVQNAVFALGRKMDYEIIVAFQGTSYTGVAGATQTSVVAGNEVAVTVGGSNSKLNVAKLVEVKRLMRANHVDFEAEEVYCGLTAADEAALLGEIQIISSDFNGADRPVLQEGRIVRFLGINFVYCELIETYATGTNKVNVPVWVKSGMYMGLWNDIQTDIAQRKDLQSQPWQAYALGTFGATRIEENKVYNIVSYRA